MDQQETMQAIVVPAGEQDSSRSSVRLALYGPDGQPLSLGSGGGWNPSYAADPDVTEAEREFNVSFSPGAEIEDDTRIGTFVAYTVIVSAFPGETVAVQLRSDRFAQPILARVGLDRGTATPSEDDSISIEGTLTALVERSESLTIVALGSPDNVGFIEQTETPLILSL